MLASFTEKKDHEHNAAAILARLAHANMILERVDPSKSETGMQWIKCSDRLPTVADGDASKNVIVRDKWNLWKLRWKDVREDDGEWLSGACEREQERSE